jgi:uncharacterized protein YggL (DUF469 family)
MSHERRSRRLREKLRLGEFREHGLRLDCRVRDPASEMRVPAEMAEVTLPRAMAFLYEDSGRLFLSRSGGGTLTEGDHQAIRRWLEGRADVAEFRVHPLEDARHPPRAVKRFARPRSRTGTLARLAPEARR